MPLETLNLGANLINAFGAASQQHEFAADFADWNGVPGELHFRDCIIRRSVGQAFCGHCLIERGT